MTTKRLCAYCGLPIPIHIHHKAKTHPGRCRELNRERVRHEFAKKMGREYFLQQNEKSREKYRRERIGTAHNLIEYKVAFPGWRETFPMAIRFTEERLVFRRTG